MGEGVNGLGLHMKKKLELVLLKTALNRDGTRQWQALISLAGSELHLVDAIFTLDASGLIDADTRP